MKKIYVLISVLAISLSVAAQPATRTVYYDALYLKTVYTQFNAIKTSRSNQALFAYYFNTAGMAQLQIDAAIKANPFFSPIYSSGGAAGAPALAPNSFLSSLGGLNVTSLADGLSQFLINRAKEELLTAFFSKLQDPKQFPDFRIVFPNAAVLVDNFNSWEYANIVSTLRAAFDKDLKSLLTDIPNLSTLDSTQYQGAVKTRIHAIKVFLDSDDGKLLMAAMQIGNGFISGQKLPDIINNVAGSNFLGGLSNADEQNTIKLINIISLSVRSNDAGRNYISAADFTALAHDPITLQIYLGLLYQEIKNQDIKIGAFDASVVAKAQILVINCVGYVQTLVAKTDAIDADIANLAAAKAKGDTDLSKYWSAIFASGQQFMQNAANVAVIDPSFTLSPKLQKAIDLSINTIEIATDIGNKDYQGAILSTVKMISDNASNKASLTTFGQFVIKYGAFAANIVQAKSSADVENAIESVALPAGSYAIKQRSQYNFSLNGYLGYGWDFDKISLNSKYIAANGLYAPIGFSLSTGGKKGNGAFTLFASVIDVGSFVLYNMRSDTTDKLKQDIRLESIISPSAQIFYEVPKWPIAVGAGWRRTPKLYFSDDSGFIAVQPRNVFNISILIDIPILTLYNSPRTLIPK